MKGRHAYSAICLCYRCKGIRNSPMLRAALKKRVPRERKASKEEQHARYIDCGPQNWDDR